MLRITVVESSRSAVTLRVEGRIAGPWVDELREACEIHALRDGARLSLELSDISFADADGVALLRQLRGRDVELTRITPFLAEQLRQRRRATKSQGT